MTAVYIHHRYGRCRAPRPAADITPKIDLKYFEIFPTVSQSSDLS